MPSSVHFGNISPALNHFKPVFNASFGPFVSWMFWWTCERRGGQGGGKNIDKPMCPQEFELNVFGEVEAETCQVPFILGLC